MDDGFIILSSRNILSLSYYVEKPMTKRLLGLLMVVGLMVGCNGVSSTDIDNLKEENIQLRDEIGDISSRLDSLSQEGREENIQLRVDGIGEGKYVWYNESGEVKVEINFVDGRKEGKEVWYYEGGGVWLERNYVDGKLEGKWVEYDGEGKTIGEWCYQNGESADCPNSRE